MIQKNEIQPGWIHFEKIIKLIETYLDQFDNKVGIHFDEVVVSKGQASHRLLCRDCEIELF